MKVREPARQINSMTLILMEPLLSDLSKELVLGALLAWIWCAGCLVTRNAPNQCKYFQEDHCGST
jgi:hypothetical protein